MVWNSAPRGTVATRSAWVLETPGLGSSTDVSEPVESSKPRRQESIGKQLFEEIIQINRSGLGVCQGCGKRLLEGFRCEIYAFRPCGSDVWQAGQAWCVDCSIALDALATLGVHEVVVEGRVGRCVDQTEQCSWRVLLDPVTRSVSPCHVTAAFDALDEPASRCCAAGCVEGDSSEAACVAGMRGKF